MSIAWKPVPLRRPYRVMVVGCGTETFFAAGEDEQQVRFFPRFKQVLAEWEELGASEDPWAWNLIYEVDDLDVAAAMIQAVRERVGGVRLDAYVKVELRIGRPFFAREE